jgi:tight adherence protein C
VDLPVSVIAGAAAVGVAIPLLIFGLATDRRRDDGAVRRNLGGASIVIDERQRVLQQSALDRAIMPAIRSVASRARRLTPAGWVESLDRRLRLAGSPARWSLERVLAVKAVCGIVGVALAVLFLATQLSFSSVLLATVASTMYFMPDLILWGRGQERQQAISLALPDTLDQMTISVEAGLGFDAALERVATHTAGPLADELARLLNEIKIGVNRHQALQNLVERTDVPELRHFVYTIRQAEDFGLPVANVLRVQAGELRIKRRQRAEERALKMPVKIVFPLVLCIFPALFIVVLGPAIIRISEVL